jgi:hypothetical protein
MADARLATSQATSQTRAGRVARRASPLGPAGLFACPSHQARGQRDSTNQMRAGARPPPSSPSSTVDEGSVTRRAMSCTGRAMPCTEWSPRRRARSPSVETS